MNKRKNLFKMIRNKDNSLIIQRLFMCILSFIIMIMAALSFSWFSMNRKTNSDGMKVIVEATPNLVIGKTAAEISSLSINPSDHYSIDYTEAARTKMAPATAAVSNNEWDTQIVTPGDNVTGLKYVTNTFDIDFFSGVEKPNKVLNFAAVPVASDSEYYIDFDVFIASASKELDATTLSATISSDSTEDSHMAATIVFYQDFVSSANMKGSIAVANKSTGLVSFTLTDNKIPVNTGTPIHIIARCYFDGALMNGSTAYINSATVDTTSVALKVTYTATEPSGT